MPPTKAVLPIEESPVAALRGDELQRTFAHQVGMSRMALLRFEQGCIPEPSIKFIPFLPSGLPWEAFVEDYHAYQFSKRQSNYGVLTPDTDFNSRARLHPLQLWMHDSQSCDTITTLCVALCLHLPTMYAFLNGPKFPALPPESFLDALLDSGYERPLIADFILAYAEWRSAVGGK